MPALVGLGHALEGQAKIEDAEKQLEEIMEKNRQELNRLVPAYAAVTRITRS